MNAKSSRLLESRILQVTSKKSYYCYYYYDHWNQTACSQVGLKSLLELKESKWVSPTPGRATQLKTNHTQNGCLSTSHFFPPQAFRHITRLSFSPLMFFLLQQSCATSRLFDIHLTFFFSNDLMPHHHPLFLSLSLSLSDFCDSVNSCSSLWQSLSLCLSLSLSRHSRATCSSNTYSTKKNTVSAIDRRKRMYEARHESTGFC